MKDLVNFCLSILVATAWLCMLSPMIPADVSGLVKAGLVLVALFAVAFAAVALAKRISGVNGDQS